MPFPRRSAPFCAAATLAAALIHSSLAAADPNPLLKAWFAGFVALPKTQLRVHRFETTQNIYALVAGTNPSRWTGEDHSVEMVSWDDAVAFCEKATRLLREAGLITAAEAIRLPTGSEWELACRAGTTTAYAFGDDARSLGDYGWFDGNAAGNDPAVGARKPNPWGLFDCHGYVWEWCAGAVGEEREIRGGAWTSTAEECRSDSHRKIARDTRRPDVGFRCVLAAAWPARP